MQIILSVFCVISKEKLNILMRLFYYGKTIVFVVCILAICCGCSISRRNIDKQLSRSFDDLRSIELAEQIIPPADGNTDIDIVVKDIASDLPVSVPDPSVVSPKINPGMLLNVSVEVAGKDEIFKESCNVSREGNIYLPLLKNVPVVGLTIMEAEKKLTDLCSRYFVAPQVDLAFSRASKDKFISPWGYVTVRGNVVKPQRIALPQGKSLKLSEAVTLAGGLAKSAKDRSVMLIRRSSDGKIVKKKVNLHSIVARGKIDRDVDLLPDDYIFVPETIF